MLGWNVQTVKTEYVRYVELKRDTAINSEYPYTITNEVEQFTNLACSVQQGHPCAALQTQVRTNSRARRSTS